MSSNNTESGLETMRDFFDARSEGYDAHMQNSVESFFAFYKQIGSAISQTDQPLSVLDLGCGTGLELEGILDVAPNVEITGIDVSPEMLRELQSKFRGRTERIVPIAASYLKYPFEANTYDYIFSVMTMHHLTREQKHAVYSRIRKALAPDGRYIEGDWIISKEEEAKNEIEYEQRSENAKWHSEAQYHVDLPLSTETQRDLFREAGLTFNLLYEREKTAVFEGTKG